MTKTEGTAERAATRSRDYLGRIQILRFFAAVAVLAAHAQHEVAAQFSSVGNFTQFTAIDGGIGVDVFFLISGFIMYHISGSSFGSLPAARAFIIRRFVRVAPLYYVATVLMLIAIVAAGDTVDSGTVSAPQIAASFAFIPYENSLGQIAPILKLGWTLTYEAYFYVVFAIALLFPLRIGPLIMAGILVATVIGRMLFLGLATVLDFWGNPIIFEFLGGMVIAVLYHRGVVTRRSASWLLVAAGIALAVVLRGRDFYGPLPRIVFHGIPAALIVGAVVLAPVRRRGGPITRFLEAGGDASYALYLFHPFAIRATVLAFTILGGPPMPGLLIAVIVAITVTMSLFINRWIETPMDRWIRAFLHRRKPPPSQLT